MIIKLRSRFFCLVICCTLLACNVTGVTYEVKNDYTGPCIVFIYKGRVGKNEAGNVVKLENGLARVSKTSIDSRFTFVDDSLNEIKIIPIGKQETAPDNIRYIFELSKGVSSSRCSKTDLNIISFFAGTKRDYLDWSNKFQDNFMYFDVIGVKWCEYYKAGLEQP